MSYSCSDFTDSILDALQIKVPEESQDSPSNQADLALAEIQRLQRFEKSVRFALDVLRDTSDTERFAARCKVVAAE